MEPHQLTNPDNREFMDELFAALIKDRTAFCPDVRIIYRFAHGEYVGKFVRTSLLVEDQEYEIPKDRRKILEIGDGVLQASSHGGNGLKRLIQRVAGIPRQEPYNLHRIGYTNPFFFQEGSRAKEVLDSINYRNFTDL